MRRNHFLLSILIVTSSITLTAQNLHRYTASLPATDGLGRRLPTWEEVGDERPDRFVGLFYWTWHTNFADLTSPFDVTKFLAAHPDAIDDYDAPAWGGDHPTHFWGEPLFGYYRDTDPWVLRKHAEMLGEAGVDVIIFDCTNGNYSWRESYMALCEVFEQARRDGVKTPQIAFILAFGPKKARALRDAIEGPYSHCCTVSALQMHEAGIIVCDEDAIGECKVNNYKYFKAVEAAEEAYANREPGKLYRANLGYHYVPFRTYRLLDGRFVLSPDIDDDLVSGAEDITVRSRSIVVRFER